MSRRISTKKRFPRKELQEENLLLVILINRILKEGKKFLARKILEKTLALIEQKIKKNPILVLEKAVRNVSPRVQLKALIIKEHTYQAPVLVSRFRSVNIAAKWIVEFSKKRPGKSMSLRLANEIIDAAKGVGSSVRKKEETHKMAESNKAFIQQRIEE